VAPDALYWVDDYKDIYADTRTFTRFLQGYSRNLSTQKRVRGGRVRFWQLRADSLLEPVEPPETDNH